MSDAPFKFQYIRRKRFPQIFRQTLTAAGAAASDAAFTPPSKPRIVCVFDASTTVNYFKLRPTWAYLHLHNHVDCGLSAYMYEF